MANENIISQDVMQGPVDPPIKKLYSVVKERGLYTKSFDEFKTKYNTPESIDFLYGVVKDKKLYSKSLDNFRKQYFGDIKASTPSTNGSKTIVPLGQSKKTNISFTDLGKIPNQPYIDVNNRTDLRNQFQEEVDKADGVITSAWSGIDDIAKDVILNNKRREQAERARMMGVDNTSVKPLLPAALQAQENKRERDEIPEEDINAIKNDPQQNIPLLKENIKKLNSQGKEQEANALKASIYTKIASDRADNTRIPKIQENINKIKNGELDYDPELDVLIKPVGGFEAIKEGYKSRTEQLDGGYELASMDKEEGIKFLNKQLEKHDPDEPVVSPSSTGALIGSEGIITAKGLGAAALTGLLTKNPYAASAAATAATTSEASMRSYYNEFLRSYSQLKIELREQNPTMPESEIESQAYDKASANAKIAAVSDATANAAMNVAGVRLGGKVLKPVAFSKNVLKTVKNISGGVADFAKAGAKEGIANAAVSGGLEVGKNIASNELGIKRDISENVIEAAGSALAFQYVLGGLIHAVKGTGAAALKAKRTILSELSRQPIETVQFEIGKMVNDGVILPDDAELALIELDNYKKLDSQIPETVKDPETRSRIVDKIIEYNELNSKIKGDENGEGKVSELMAKPLKERATQLQEDVEILSQSPEVQVEMLTQKKNELEGQLKADSESRSQGKGAKIPNRNAAKERLKEIKKQLEDVTEKVNSSKYKAEKIIDANSEGLSDIDKGMAQADPEGYLKHIAEQAQGVDDKGNSLEGGGRMKDMLNNGYSKKLIDAAIEMFPAKKQNVSKIPNEATKITVKEVIDKPITYKGEKGRLYQDGQTLVFEIEGNNREIEIGNIDKLSDADIADMGITYKKPESVNINEDGSINIRGNDYVNNYSDPLQAINYDDNGEVVSVNLETRNGQKRTFKGEVAKSIADKINAKVENTINEHSKQISKEGQTPSELELNSVNPTGSIFADYTPEQRMNAPLGENMVTLDKTIGGSPNDVITIYRGGKGNEIVGGDYVTTNKKLAQDYAGTENVLELKVKKGDIIDDITEPGGEEYIYRPSKSDKYLSTNKNTQDAYTKQSTAKMDVRQQAGDGEGVGKGNPEHKEPSGEGIKKEGKTTGEKEEIDTSLISEEPEMTGITHAQMDETAREFGLETYEENPETREQWNNEALNRIKNNPKAIPDLLDKMKKGDSPSAVEQRMMAFYIADLKAKMRAKATPKLLAQINEAKNLSNIVGGRNVAKSLVARKGINSIKTIEEITDFDDYLTAETEALGVKTLDQEHIDNLSERFNKEQELKKQIDAAYEKGKADQSAKFKMEQEEAAKKAAQNELTKNIKSTKKTTKTSEDFAKERKDIIAQMRKDLLDIAKGKGGLMVNIPGVAQFGAISPHVAKLMKSFAEQGVRKLDDMVTKIYDEIKDHIPNLKKSDVLDIIGGKYSSQQNTRSQLAEDIVNMRKEARLLLELDRIRKREPKTFKQKADKERRINELEKQITETKRFNRIKDELDKEPVYDVSIDDPERLKKRRDYLLNKIDKRKNEIKNGLFIVEKPEPKRLVLDEKTQALEDEWIRMQRIDAARRAKHEYDKMNKWDKAVDKIMQVSDLKRAAMVGADFSILLRQANPITTNPVKFRRNIKAIKAMATQAFSPKKYAREQYYLEKSEIGRLFTEFKGEFSNPSELRVSKREEEFATTILTQAKNSLEAMNNEKVNKALEVVDKVWFSERAAAALLNTMRIEEFGKMAASLRKAGLTPENAPKEYEAAVKHAMNLSGRGNMIKALEDSHAGRMIANRTYFGARLMAAKINLLNPVYYANLPKQTRIQAIKDLAFHVGSMFLIGSAFKVAGFDVSFNPDDTDFLQVRKGDLVLDISGGSAAYVRTFLRIIKSVYGQTKHGFGSKAANSYTRFALKSAGKSLITNKLAPNTSYFYHALTGKSNEYDESGRLKPFDPIEIFDMYPMYVDDVMEANEKMGTVSALGILMANLSGVGTQVYPKRVGSGKPNVDKIGRPKLNRSSGRPKIERPKFER